MHAKDSMRVQGHPERNYSGLLVACGDSLSLVVSAGIAACGGNARTHHQTERVAAGDEES